MNLVFTLSMPNNNSWNGRWTGEDRYYAIVKAFGTAKRTRARYEPIIGKAFSYNFGDGWRASVSVREVDGKEARLVRAKTKGFCGYDWMVDEIMQHGRILTLAEREKAA
jgi:hypothetical protein